jgi:serine protease Do
MATIEGVQDAIKKVAAESGPRVVGIGQRWGVGSGVLLGSGRIVTNAHNVRRQEVNVTLPDGEGTTGRVVGLDVDADVAIVEVDANGAGGIQWDDKASDGLDIGSPVFALSNPGGRGLRVTLGFVSGTDRSFRGPRGRRIAGSIEHTAPLLPGSSGGPIVDEAGRFLGLNTNRLGEGFYLAIPADASLKDKVDSLGRGETPAKPRLGVALAPRQVARDLRRAVGLPEQDGLLVRQVEEGSPADSAGVAEGDLIIGAGGKEVTTFDDLHDALDGAKDSLVLKIVRGTEDREVTVQFAGT